MKYDQEIIRKNIATERKKLGLSQDKLGAKIHTVGKQISNYENGITLPPLGVMLKLCEVFNCELGYLLGEKQYQEGTQARTIVMDYTGLSFDAMNALLYITGTDKACLSFGY